VGSHGNAIRIANVGIDVSYNPNNDPSLKNEMLKSDINAVYTFCKMSGRFFIPVRGYNNELRDMLTRKRTHPTFGIDYYPVDVDTIKSDILDNIDKESGPGAIHFPQAYTDDEFRQFLSEIWGEVDDTGRMGFVKINERNEMLDTYVYARAVASILQIDRFTTAMWNDHIENLERG
jgi:phage terminase large subunit GpA-like protein